MKRATILSLAVILAATGINAAALEVALPETNAEAAITSKDAVLSASIVDTAKAVDERMYTTDTYLALQDALAAFESGDAEEADVQTAYDALVTLDYAKVIPPEGSIYGSGGRYDSLSIATHQYILDGNTATFADYHSSMWGVGNAGFDLGEGNAVIVKKIRYYLRNETYLNGCYNETPVQGSNDKESFTQLAMLDWQEPMGQWVERTVSNNTAFRYLQVTPAANCHGNICEMEYYTYGHDFSTLDTMLIKAAAYETDLSDEIAAATAVRSKAYPTQDLVNDQVIILRDAIAALEAAKTPKDLLGAAIDSFEALDSNAYTYASFITAYKAYLDAKDVYNDAGATDEECENAIKAMNTAIAALALYDGSASYELFASDYELFGEGGTWKNSAVESYPLMFDGNIDTYSNFDGDHETTGYGGIDLGVGTKKSVASIQFYYIDQWGVAGRFEGSNDKVNWTTLGSYTASGYPKDKWNTVTVTNTEKFRYLRIYCTARNGNICEVRFFARAEMDVSVLNTLIDEAEALYNDTKLERRTELLTKINAAKELRASSDATLFDVAAMATALEALTKEIALEDLYNKFDTVNENAYTTESYFAFVETKAAFEAGEATLDALKIAYNKLQKLDEIKITAPSDESYFGYGGTWAGSGESYLKMFDGDETTYSDFGATWDGAGEGGIDLGEAVCITKVRYMPRTGVGTRYGGCKLQGSNDKETWTTFAIVASADPAGSWKEITVKDDNTYRYVRIDCPAQTFGSMFEVEFYTYAPDFGVLANAVLDAIDVTDVSDDDLAIIGALADEGFALVEKPFVGQKTINDFIKTITETCEEAQIRYANTPVTLNLTSIRTSGTPGLRFAAYVTDAQREACSSYGFLVARENDDLKTDPAHLVFNDAGAASGKNAFGINYISSDAYNTANGIDKVYAEDGTAFGMPDVEATFFTGVMQGIPKGYYHENLVARPYLVVNGVTFYGKAHASSLYVNAYAVREGGYEGLDDAGIAYIDSILEAVESDVNIDISELLK